VSPFVHPLSGENFRIKWYKLVMSSKFSLKRNTGVNCPNCVKGFIVDQRAYSVAKDIPLWICSNSLSDCTYTEKYGKKWQWASWEWEIPYFILINESQETKHERENYENNIKLSHKAMKKKSKFEEKIIKGIKFCRVCGSRSCQKINNCM